MYDFGWAHRLGDQNGIVCLPLPRRIQGLRNRLLEDLEDPINQRGNVVLTFPKKRLLQSIKTFLNLLARGLDGPLCVDSLVLDQLHGSANKQGVLKHEDLEAPECRGAHHRPRRPVPEAR